MNPMLSQLNRNKIASQIKPIKQAVNVARSVGNPQMMMNQMMQNNHMYAQVQQIIQQHGGDAKAAFYSMCNQFGVDPNEILNQLK